jgi:hypothetical protein
LFDRVAWQAWPALQAHRTHVVRQFLDLRQLVRRSRFG